MIKALYGLAIGVRNQDSERRIRAAGFTWDIQTAKAAGFGIVAQSQGSYMIAGAFDKERCRLVRNLAARILSLLWF